MRSQDVSNLQSPKFISRLSFNDTIAGGYSDFLCLVDSTILAARKSKKLFAIDVGNPSNPEIKSTYSMRGIPVGISISNDYLYVADSDTGIQIFNVSDPYALNEVGFYKMISLRGLTIAKEELFAIGGEEIGPGKQGFVGYDITNPLSPTLKYILNIPGGISVVDLKNESNIAYLAYNNTFIAVDISNPDTGKIVYLGDAYTDPNTPGAGTFNSVALFNGTVLTGYLGVTVFNNAATSVKEKHNTLPDSFELFQNYPNPFNPSTVIKYQLPSAGYVTLTIYDILGRKVDRLINKFQNAGNYTTLFEASKLSSGVYFYRLKVVNIDGEKYTLTKKMELLK